MSCKMCGQCCRNINMPIGTKNRLDFHNGLKGISSTTGRLCSTDVYFMKRHWKYLGLSKNVGGFVLNNKYGEHEFEIFKCEFVTEDNKCSIHKNNPDVCAGYPWYTNKEHNINYNFPWNYKGCGYEKISYIGFMIKALLEVKKQKEKNLGNM